MGSEDLGASFTFEYMHEDCLSSIWTYSLSLHKVDMALATGKAGGGEMNLLQLVFLASRQAALYKGATQAMGINIPSSFSLKNSPLLWNVCSADHPRDIPSASFQDVGFN